MGSDEPLDTRIGEADVPELRSVGEAVLSREKPGQERLPVFFAPR
jgi:hypothetical protein